MTLAFLDGWSFLAPAFLVLLLVPAVLAAAYFVQQRRRGRYAVRLSTVELLDRVAPDKPGWRRHLPALALLVGLVAVVVGLAQPAVAREKAKDAAVVILAIDTSVSMEATDVTPSRIEAAKAAAGTFLDSVPDGVRVGVVGFDARARTAIEPTTDTDAVRAAIDRLTLGGGTAIGEAVFTGLDDIAAAFDQPADGSQAQTPDGSAPPATIVLLSDGETTQGRDNAEAAQAATAAGISVQTIAFGTDHGTVEAQGQRISVPVNAEALAQLAEDTGGQTYPADSASKLTDVYEKLGRSVETEKETDELAPWFVGGAMAMVTLAAIGSLLWFNRLP